LNLEKQLFQRATREGNWFLYLAALEKLCVYFFAYNRLDYAQNIPEYIACMHDMKTTDPDIWQEFVNGEFTVNTSTQTTLSHSLALVQTKPWST